MFHLIQNQITEVLRTSPEGMSQAQIAAHLGIPRQKDNNWITYYALRSMQEDGLVTKNDQKRFSLA